MSRISQHPTERDRAGLHMAMVCLARRQDIYKNAHVIPKLLLEQIDSPHAAKEPTYNELADQLQLAHMRIKELDLLFGRYILAMRSALIEEEHGKGPAAGMEWIYNSLAGPGELPPEGETQSQAYFDREIVAIDSGMREVMEFHQKRREAQAVQP